MSNNLNTYHWRGISSQGQWLRGNELAQTKELAALQLQQKQIHITHLSIQKNYFLKWTQARIKPQDILSFFRHLARLLSAGIPLNTALHLTKPNAHTGFRIFIDKVLKSIEQGFNLSTTLENFSAHFDSHTRQLILIGEQTGTLDKQISLICAYKEKQLQLKKQLQSLLFYPLILVCITLLITLGMLIFIIPRFAQMYQQFHTSLPVMTRFVLQLSSLLFAYGPYFFGCIAFSFVLIRLVSTSTARAAFKEKILLRLPFVHTFILNIMALHLARALSTQLEAGITLSEALGLWIATQKTSRWLSAFVTLKVSILKGEAFSKAIEDTQLFSGFFLQMIKIGEQSGTLGTSLNQIADIYQSDIEEKTQRFMQLLEPLIIMILGALIGGLVIAMYLPIFTLGTAI